MFFLYKTKTKHKKHEMENYKGIKPERNIKQFHWPLSK